MGIQSFLIFGDICQNNLKDTGYFVKNLMRYGILGPPPFQGLKSTCVQALIPWADELEGHHAIRKANHMFGGPRGFGELRRRAIRFQGAGEHC